MGQRPLTGAAEASDLSMETHLKSAQGPVYGADESQSAKVFIHPYTVVDRFSRHRFSRNPDLVENFAVTNHFYSIKIQYSRKFDLVD